jgi:hypothetical protein
MLRDPLRRTAALRLLGGPLPARDVGAAVERALHRGSASLRSGDDLAPRIPISSDGEARSGDDDARADAVHWIEIELVDMAGAPVPSERYEISTPDGAKVSGRLGSDGRARVDGIEKPGECEISFPDLDRDAWGSV